MLRQWMEEAPPGVAALIVLLVLAVCALFEPSHGPANYAAQASPYDEAANHHLWEVISAVGAVGACIFTGALAVFAFFQVRDSRRSSERQLRAYVCVVSAAREGPHGKVMTFAIGIKNTGQTPAYNVRLKSGISFSDLGHEIAPVLHEQVSTILGPGEGITHRTDNKEDPLLEAHVPLFVGPAKFFVGFEISYIDAFGRTRHTGGMAAYTKNGFRNGLLDIVENRAD